METNYHQQLMDEAYNNWKSGWNKRDFYLSLEPKHRAAVVIGNLNYQVENGGFYQWVDNRYAEDSKDFLYFALKEMGKQENIANTVIELLDKVYDINPLDNDDSEEDYQNPYNIFDDKYYEINEDFMKKTEEWLKNYGN